MREDLKHTNEFGDIEVFKDTSYWFKRDWKTIKNSFKNTLERTPFIVIFSIFPTTILSIYYKSTGIQEIFTLFTLTFFLSLLANALKESLEKV